MRIPEKITRMHNAVCVCIDSSEDGLLRGRFYHLYSKDAVEFSDIVSFLERISMLMDEIHFPEQTVKVRTFKKAEPARSMLIGDSERVVSFEELSEHRGSLGSFIMAVTSRENASWQGELYSIEDDKMEKFYSDIELLNLFNKMLFLDT